MDSRVNSVAGGDVEGQLVQFSIDVQAVAVCARVGVECEAIGAGGRLLERSPRQYCSEGVSGLSGEWRNARLLRSTCAGARVDRRDDEPLFPDFLSRRTWSS